MGNDNMNLSTVSFICKRQRLKKKLTIRQLAELAYSSSSVISKFENASNFPKEDAINCILSALDVELFEDEKVLDKNEKLIKKAFFNLVHFEYVDANACFEKLDEYEDQLLTSRLAIDYALLKVAIGLHYYRNVDLEDQIGFLDDVKNTFTMSQMRTFYYLKAFHQGLKYNFTSTIDLLWKALENNSQNAEISDALIYFQIGFIYSSVNRPLLAIKYTTKAKEMFDKANSFRRSLYCLINISDQYITLGNYDYAEETLESVILSAKSFSLEHILSLCYDLLSIVKLSNQEDEEAFELSKLSLENKPKSRNDMYFNLILAGYRLGYIDQVKEYINQVYHVYEEKEYLPTYQLVKYIDMLINDETDENLMKYLKKIVTNERVSDYIVYKKFVVRELLNLYERNRIYKEAFLLCKEMANLD